MERAGVSIAWLTKPSAPTTRSSDWISPTPPSTAPSTSTGRGEGTGRNPADRGNWLEVVDPDDRAGIPIGWATNGATPRQRPFHPDTALGAERGCSSTSRRSTSTVATTAQGSGPRVMHSGSTT